MKIKLPPYLKVIIKLGITIAALYFVIRKIDIRQVTEVISGANLIFLTGALVLFILSKMISSVRLNRYLAAIGIHLSEGFNIKLYLLGMYYNLFLPGGIGGDGYKIYFLNKRFKVKTVQIFWAVMMDRIIGVLALFCLAVIFLYFIPLPRIYGYFAWALIPLSVLVTYLVFRYFFMYLLPVFMVTNLQSFVVQMLQLLSALMILYSLQVGGNFGSYLLVFLISSIVAVLPITIGGIGSREFTFMLGAQWLGLDLNLSIALSVIFYLITAFTSIWGIIYSIGPGLQIDKG
ncbi:MAG: flippase-like domain-containing protein [Bacteroidales bacterium]|nr:flippase-like domain-containing protein [Bacteroidales bacterium]